MKKFSFALIAGALVAAFALAGCDFLAGPDEPAGGGGNLVISFGNGGGRAITSGGDLPGEVLEALRYEITLTGPGGEALDRTVTGEESVRLTVALGIWRIDARAYKEDGLAGTGSVDLQVVPGVNSVRVPMVINGGYFTITVDPPVSGGTVETGCDAAFPEATVTLKVTPEAGYVFKAGSLTVNGDDGTVPVGGSGPTYTFTMPASDVTVSAAFNPSFGITIEGPRDEGITVTAAHSAGHTPPTDISWSGDESVAFTVDGYTVEGGNLLWLVDGSPKTGTGRSLTIKARDYAQRIHTLTVMIKVNDQWYSTETGFTVTP